MNKLITIAALVLLYTNGFAQSKLNAVKRTVLTHKIITNGLLEYYQKRGPYSIVSVSGIGQNQSVSANSRGCWRSYGIKLLDIPQRNVNKIASVFPGVVSIGE